MGSLKGTLSSISRTQIGKARSNATAAVRFWLQNSDVGKEDSKMELNSCIKAQIRIFFSLSSCFFLHNTSCSQFDSVPVQN